MLGGTSVFGGRGTIGARCSALVFRYCRTGLHLAALPSELTGMLTGVLSGDHHCIDRVRDATEASEQEDESMKNSHSSRFCAERFWWAR